MTDADCDLRPFEPGDERALNEAFNQVFGLDRPLDEWLWKFPATEAGRAIMLAWRGDELLAQYAALPVRFEVDQREWSAAQIVDVFSTRAARRQLARRGVWVRTVEAFFAEYGTSGRLPLLFGFPGRRALRLGVLQLGYDALSPQPIQYLARRRPAGPAIASRLIYRAELARDWEPRIDGLWSRARVAYPVSAVRDADRCARRLAGHPTVRYHRFLVMPRLSDEAVAFAAFRTDGGRCRWVDLVWDHDHPGALEQLARLGRRLAEQSGCDHEEMWLNGDPRGVQVLESAGFERLDEPNGLVMVARSFDPDLEVAALDGRVYLTMADADLV